MNKRLIDAEGRPLVYHNFSLVSSGQLIWTFAFDWARLQTEQDYRLYMQLGEGTLMSDAGVGVDLVWTLVGKVHKTLAARQGGATTTPTG